MSRFIVGKIERISHFLQPSLSFFLSFFHETISQRLTSLVSFHQRVSYNLLIIITTIAQVDIHPFCRCFIHCDDCAWMSEVVQPVEKAVPMFQGSCSSIESSIPNLSAISTMMVIIAS